MPPGVSVHQLLRYFTPNSSAMKTPENIDDDTDVHEVADEGDV
jgi:hypothetical protein